MASFTIQKRPKANGEFSFRCLIRIKKSDVIVHSESKTFSKKEVARTWALARVNELQSSDALNLKKTVSIGALLNLYFEDHDLWSKSGRTKRHIINMLMDCDISKVKSDQLKTSDLIAHCKNRRASGTGPVTINHDIAYLRSVMKKALPVWDISANYQIFEDAVPVLTEMNLISKSQKRTRRPTENELDRLREGLQARMDYRPNRTSRIPFLDILDFSILTCMRIGEVCKLRWEDLNEDHKTILVRDRKDPRKKAGNHMIAPLLGGSFDIVKRQSRNDDLIFPYKCYSVTAGFQRVRSELGIEDLRYHDLRREGASRLFEKGYSIEEVAQVTGHRNLNILWQVYTQLFPHKLHDKFADSE